MKNDTKPQTQVNRSRAVASGTIFGNVDCYVLEDGSTVLSQRGMLRGLRGKTPADGGAEDGDLGRYLARLPEKYSGLAAAPFSFVCPDGSVAVGRPSHDFVAMCRAYAEMLADGSIHKARLPMARNAVAILSKLAERGIDEIVYEASNWHPRAVVAPQGLTVDQLAASLAPLSAGFAAIAQMLTSVNDRVSALESRSRDGRIGPEQANAIKARVRFCAKSLAGVGAEKVRAASMRIHKRLKMAVGWYGDRCRLDNLPARHEADVLYELDIIEHETRGRVEGARQIKLPLSLVGNGNAKRASA